MMYESLCCRTHCLKSALLYGKIETKAQEKSEVSCQAHINSHTCYIQLNTPGFNVRLKSCTVVKLTNANDSIFSCEICFVRMQTRSSLLLSGRPNIRIRIRIRPNPSKIRTESESLITISKNPKFSQKGLYKISYFDKYSSFFSPINFQSNKFLLLTKKFI